MAKLRDAGKLTAIKIKSMRVTGRFNDGRGLYLVVRPDSRAWVFRYRDRATRKLRDVGLGAAADVSLESARAKRDELRAMLAEGRDPLAERREARMARALAAARQMTFAQCRDAYIDAHAPSWRNEKHAAQWRSTLTNDAKLLSPLPVAEITTDLVVKVLADIWQTKTETATRLRQRIEAVLDWATVRKFRTGDNPARWRGHLDKLLAAPSKVKKVKHQEAMPYTELPDFMVALRAKAGMAPRLLELVILTAARVGEAAAARWSEFDLDAKVWTIPGERMKAGREHRVALSTAAVTLLRGIPRTSEAVYVFPGLKAKTHIHPESARKMLQKDMKRESVTVHGFRSSFRDWAAERTSFAGDVVEAALAHAVKDKTEAAYKRTDLFAKRARLMEAWAGFIATEAPKAAGMSSVSPINKSRGGAG